ncbi:beta-ketoacyl synthase N-terminal-like domain-containing protein [Actinokineospora sp. UTMC 2448]|uniref:beta-ketoacyl synthase N-terminal-like domain-containing protein n=1 Tax=Actinokineospora sp. UTMC 2448 TaxID=2268449 RepID=UPI0021646883|nr:beta-ketoacyl synthase N-terminal-like domain-containing protein [Actinokineospora sp. UTMC 2448]UVS80640.1 3-oxoacyl-[acyl-carrier-protein] synthase 2 [Actinokineospora sp. UTMC 2448]
MSTATAPVITAWSAVSPYGVGRAAFVDGLHARTATATELDKQVWAGPDDTACLVPDFTAAGALGKKGTRSMDRATGLAVAAVGRMLDDQPAGRETATGDHAALVLGTTTGSAQSMMDFTRDSLTSEKPFFVDPSRFPNTVMNCAAGQCAIWHQLRGPNATVAGGRVAGLHALNYGRRLLLTGRANTALCGAVEEYSAARAWLHRIGATTDTAVLGEGCAMLQVEHGGSDRALADVLSVEFGAFATDYRDALRACVRRALDRSGTTAADVWAVSPCGTAGPGEAEVLAGYGGVRPDLSGIGDTAGAAAAMQIAAVLALAERDRAAAGRTALVTAVDQEGVVGCTVLRLH